ncbi:hypothetical protein EJ02DRAFT_382546 [Clathrospora elynae]|uniref:Tc1-like transposase DDE domain-containing protein n=1 Tax=Clathrospora elynae TaxID=706981 RepID=A0A6A5SGS1_9PLEO|nr:hypothetical protein EJ02DRAFT_382546 [Clathrospora elynae]
MSDLTGHAFDTPRKARIKGAADFMNHKGLPYFHTELFRFNGVSKTRGWAILSQDNELFDRQHHNNEGVSKQRGRPSVLSPKDLERCDRFLQDFGWSARSLTWAQLAEELDLDVSGQTLRIHMGSMHYHKCIACSKGWVSGNLASKRKDWAKVMLERYPECSQWRRVRFSDEVHWSVGPEGKVRIIRKPGERYCADCIQHTLNRDDEKANQRQHSWAAVGYDFKSDLNFHTTKSCNGKMSLQVYRDQILEPIVKPWLQRGDDFVLEEDNDSGHGGGATKKRNIVKIWKEQNKLEHYFNCAQSPDLAPIENCWRPPKQFMSRFPHWDEFETRELALEGWQKVSQHFINEQVDSMPRRLQDVVDLDGQMTGW